MIINGRFLTQRVSGVQRFAREIMSAAGTAGILTAHDAEFIVPARGEADAAFAGAPVRRTGRFGGHLWEQAELPAAAKAPLVNLCGSAPIFRRAQIVVLHDAAVAAFPESFTPAFRTWYKIMISGYKRHARMIASVSGFSADEISERFGLRRDRIEIIPESGEHILRAAPDFSLNEKFGLEPDAYILAVGNRAPNKNLTGVLQAVAKLPDLPFKFVIAGGSNTKVFSGVELGTNTAIETGYVSDGQLRALYQNAACFIYPSLYEGYGIPPLEAMACGCPVLVSNTTSLPEVCGTGAAYCDPADPADIAKQLGLLLGSAQAREDLRIAGRARTRELTWAAAAHQFDALYKRLAA